MQNKSVMILIQRLRIPTWPQRNIKPSMGFFGAQISMSMTLSLTWSHVHEFSLPPSLELSISTLWKFLLLYRHAILFLGCLSLYSLFHFLGMPFFAASFVLKYCTSQNWNHTFESNLPCISLTIILSYMLITSNLLWDSPHLSITDCLLCVFFNISFISFVLIIWKSLFDKSKIWVILMSLLLSSPFIEHGSHYLAF